MYTFRYSHLYYYVFIAALVTQAVVSCNQKPHDKRKMGQHIVVNPDDTLYDESDTTYDPLKGNVDFSQLYVSPNSVLLTGMSRFRLVTIYKIRKRTDRNLDYYEPGSYYVPYEPEPNSPKWHYYMPGIDRIDGYNLTNIAHYDLDSSRLTYFFKRPVLVRSLYFPGVRSDTLHGQPVKRNFFLVTVYDEDTNKDTVINNRDLRRMYYYNENNTVRKQLIPKNYSVIRSNYDEQNDIMYVYARLDENKNGYHERFEPVHIFLVRLSAPSAATRVI
jgi:hypothetical protein